MPTLAVDPIWLETAPTQQAADAVATNSSFPWHVLITGLLVFLACLLAARYLLRRARTTDLDAAFARLARRTWLPRKPRNAILALSEASGVPAAAMLVSRGTFTAALANADTDKAAQARAAAPRIMQACFAECAPPRATPWWAGVARITKRTRA